MSTVKDIMKDAYQDGYQKRMEEVATRMLKAGKDDDYILEFADITPERLNALKKKLTSTDK